MGRDHLIDALWTLGFLTRCRTEVETIRPQSGVFIAFLTEEHRDSRGWGYTGPVIRPDTGKRDRLFQQFRILVNVADDFEIALSRGMLT